VRRGASRTLGPGFPAALLALLALAVAGVSACGGGREAPPDRGAVPEEDGAPPEGEILNLPVDLYFPAAGGRLAVVSRELPPADDPVEKVRAVVEAVLAGPRPGDGDLVRPLPEDVVLDGVYLGPGGVAYLDLRTPEPREPPAVGSKEEMQILYSLVDSVALNVAEARRVVVLWNGRQRPTFAGHLDTASPLAPNTDLVRR
jgi:hypothetical protein